MYAEITNPQSLNKYQHAFNSPLRLVDPNGHTPCCLTDDEVRAIGDGNIAIGVGKSIGNIGIGINNLMADFRIGDAKHVEPFKPNNNTQLASMIVTDDVTFFASWVFGKPQVGGVAVFAETRATTAVASELGNASAAARQLGQQGEAVSGVVRNTERIPSLTGTAKYRTPDGLNWQAKTIDEVKNVGYQARTNQIRDSIAFAQQKGFTFSLHVRSTTRLSQPLQSEITAGTIRLRTFNPGGHKF